MKLKLLLASCVILFASCDSDNNDSQHNCDASDHLPLTAEEEALNEQYIGMSLEEAEILANQQSRDLRVLCIDGVYFLRTADYISNRLNLHIDKGVVTSLRLG